MVRCVADNKLHPITNKFIESSAMADDFFHFTRHHPEPPILIRDVAFKENSYFENVLNAYTRNVKQTKGVSQWHNPKSTQQKTEPHSFITPKKRRSS